MAAARPRDAIRDGCDVEEVQEVVGPGQPDRVHRVWRIRDRYMVRGAVPRRVQQKPGSLHLRVLLEVHELGLRRLAAQAQVPGKAPAGRRDIPLRLHLHFRSRRPQEPSLLPESVTPRQAVPRLKYLVLRRGAVSLLRALRGRRLGVSFWWLLLDGVEG